MLNEPCPICDRTGYSDHHPVNHSIKKYWGCLCRSQFLIHDHELGYLKGVGSEKYDRRKMSTLLRERTVWRKQPLFLQFTRDKYNDVENVQPQYVTSWLDSEWPRTFGDKCDRTLCNLGKLSQCGGQELEIDIRDEEGSPIVTDAFPTESMFILEALERYGWILVRTQVNFKKALTVSESGWAHINSLARGGSDARNPAFVAMPFGKSADGSAQRQLALFEEIIRPAIRSAGYDAKRADTVEHNNYVMDQVMADIRRAPFLVADISIPNLGVYYESGFAVGLNIPVITCCEESKDMEVHFDIAQKNQVRWGTHQELGKRLTNRILGSIGKGPID